MIPIVKNNYIRVNDNGPNWQFSMDQCREKFDNLFLETCRAAEEIYSLKNGKIYFLYSGGIDSEHALSVFLHLRIKIIPVIIKLTPHYNDFDIAYAYKFCESKNLNPVTIDIDFDEFVKSGKILDYAKKYKSEIHHRPAVMHAISKLDGTIILGDNEPYINKNTVTNTWNYQIHEHDYALPNYFIKNNIHGTPHFGCWTIKMAMAFLTDPIMLSLANNQVPGKLGSNSSKHLIYNRHSNFNLEVRPKYTGYEIIEKSPIFQHESIKELQKSCQIYNGKFNQDYFKFMNKYLFHKGETHV